MASGAGYVPAGLEFGDLKHEKMLAHGELIGAGCELAGAAPAAVVEQVVAVALNP